MSRRHVGRESNVKELAPPKNKAFSNDQRSARDHSESQILTGAYHKSGSTKGQSLINKKQFSTKIREIKVKNQERAKLESREQKANVAMMTRKRKRSKIQNFV